MGDSAKSGYCPKGSQKNFKKIEGKIEKKETSLPGAIQLPLKRIQRKQLHTGDVEKERKRKGKKNKKKKREEGRRAAYLSEWQQQRNAEQ